MERISELIQQLREAEGQLDELIFSLVREQLDSPSPEAAKDVERRLSRARRSLQKAIATLEGNAEDH